MAEIVLITGMSGAGRSAAADVLEDLGWYVVDNLPSSLVEKIVELASLPASGIERLALVAGRNQGAVLDNVASLRSGGHQVTVLFLDASNNELVRRYDATRRKHPLAGDADGLVESIALERELVQGTRDAADLVLDTTELNVTSSSNGWWRRSTASGRRRCRCPWRASVSSTDCPSTPTS